MQKCRNEAARASITYCWRLCLRNPPPLGRVILDSSLLPLPILRRHNSLRYHASIQRSFFSVRVFAGGTERNPAMIQRRVSAGSMTSSM
jgi:hypothetical protein